MATDRPTYRIETIAVDRKGRERILKQADTEAILVYMSVAAWAESLRARIALMGMEEGRAAMLNRASRN